MSDTARRNSNRAKPETNTALARRITYNLQSDILYNKLLEISESMAHLCLDNQRDREALAERLDWELVPWLTDQLAPHLRAWLLCFMDKKDMPPRRMK